MTSTVKSLLGLPGRAIRFELSLYRSLYRWARRRPMIAPGAEAFSYVREIRAILIAFIVVSAIEIPVAHLLLPWPTVQIIVLLLGVWGLTWMIGLLASMVVYPHSVDDRELRVRSGSSLDLAIGWESIARVSYRRRDVAVSKAVQVEQGADACVLKVVVSSQTNLDVLLHEPTLVRLPRGRTATITELQFFADDPKALISRIAKHLDQAIPASC